MNFDILHVGQSRSEWKGLSDGYIMEYDNFSGLILYVLIRKPTQQEVSQITADSPFKITFTDYKGVGFFGVKFGSLPWGDCPFSPNFYENPPVFEKVEEGRGYALNVIFVDTETGTIKTLWRTELGTNFSRLFREWCENSLKRQMSRNWYDKTVTECYEEYEIRQLVRRASCQYERNPHGEEVDREQ